MIRVCLNCGDDISGRPREALRCWPCARDRKRSQTRQWHTDNRARNHAIRDALAGRMKRDSAT